MYLFKYSRSHKTHFFLRIQVLKNHQKKMTLHQNPSFIILTYNLYKLQLYIVVLMK